MSEGKELSDLLEYHGKNSADYERACIVSWLRRIANDPDMAHEWGRRMLLLATANSIERGRHERADGAQP